MQRRHLFSIPLLLAAATSLPAQETKPVDFAHDVVPILKARCARCHTDGTYKGKLSLDTRADLLRSGVVKPGKSAESELLARVTADEPERRMPPQADALTAKEVAVLKRWIDEGLAWDDGFTFKKRTYVARLAPRRPELPPERDGLSHPIDRIMDAYYREKKVEPLPLVDDATFMRRVRLDVVGLPPGVEELDAFVKDADPQKRQRLVTSVLADRRAYAEHWLTFWNDLLRNDYAGTGYIDGGRMQITGWLYRSLMENKPYDQFVRELIDASPESVGFINGIKWRGNVNASQVREVQFAQNVAQVFLGINLKCASCHDSFIDHWTLEEAYGMAAIYSSSPLEVHRCDKPTGKNAQARFLYPELGEIDVSLPAAGRLKQLAAILTSERNGRLTRTIVNRIWQRMMGRGLVEPVDVMDNEPWNEDLLDYLAVHLVDNKYDLKKTIELIATSRAYQRRAMTAEPEGDFVFRGPTPRRLTAEQFLDAVWRITGTAPGQPSANVGPRGSEPVRASLVVADALQRSLGRPNREQVVTTRPDLLTTLEAIDLSNGEALASTLTRGAGNILKAHPKRPARDTVEWLFRAALSRGPTEEEMKVALELAGDPVTPEGLSDLLWAVFMLPDFQTVQ